MQRLRSKEKAMRPTSCSIFAESRGGAVGSAQFLTALAYSAPVIERTFGRNSLSLGLRGLRAGLEAAAAVDGAEVVASQAMKRVGVWVLRLSGWQVGLALPAAEVLIWALSSNDLEKWARSSAFGGNSDGGIGKGNSNEKRFTAAEDQQIAFYKAIGSVSVRSR